MKSFEITGRIITAVQISTSTSANPKYFVIFKDIKTGETFKGKTATNASCAYGINNPNLKVSCKITYHVTRNNNIIIDYIWSN